MLHLQVLPVAPPVPYPGSESNPYVLHISGPVRCGLGFIQSRLRVQLGKVRAGGGHLRMFLPHRPAYSAQGKRWKYGGSVPTSNQEIYDDDFELP